MAKEWIIPIEKLTQEERAELALRASSPEARRRFAVELQRLRRAQDVPYASVICGVAAKEWGLPN